MKINLGYFFSLTLRLENQSCTCFGVRPVSCTSCWRSLADGYGFWSKNAQRIDRCRELRGSRCWGLLFDIFNVCLSSSRLVHFYRTVLGQSDNTTLKHSSCSESWPLIVNDVCLINPIDWTKTEQSASLHSIRGDDRSQGSERSADLCVSVLSRRPVMQIKSDGRI